MTPPSETKSKDMGARRSKRITLAIPIIMSGTDRAGNAFQETTRTILVSKHGAKIKSNQELNLGAEVTIENRSLGLAANATVVSVGKKHSPSEPVEVGVQLSHAGNVWGIIFPPEDWETGPLPGVEGGAQEAAPKPPEPATGETSSLAATAPAQPARNSQSPVSSAEMTSPGAGEPMPPKAVNPPVPSAPPLVPAAAGASRDRVDAVAAAVFAKLTKQLDEAADARLKAYAEKVVRFTNQFALRVQSNFQEAANRTEDQMVVLIQQKLGALADRVQASRAILENLLARFEALEKNSKTLVEDTEQKIREANQSALESAQRELTINLRKGVESTSATLEGECQALVLDAVTRTVNAALTKADEQLAAQAKDQIFKANAELKWQQEQMIEGVKEQLNQIALSGTTNLSARFETMAGEIVPSLHTEIEKSLQESTGRVVAQTTQSLQEQTQLLTQDALVSLQQAVQGLQDRLQEESRNVRQSTEQEITKAAEAFTQAVTQRSELAIGSVQSAVEQGADKLRTAQLESARSLQTDAEDYQKQLAAHSGMALEGFQSSLQNLTRETQEGVAQLFSQKLEGIAGELAAASAEKVRQQIQEQAVTATETFTKESSQRLSAVADEFFAKASKELQERLQSQAEAQLDAVIESAPNKFNERLNKLTHEAGLTLVSVTGKELQKIAGTLLQTSSETLHREVELLAGKLQDDFRAFQVTLADQAKKQLLAMSRSTIETMNQEALAGIEEFRTRLHTQAQESHETSLRELETQFQEALEKQRSAISALLQQQVEQSRDLVGAQIKTMSEQLVAKAAETLDQQVGKSTQTVTELAEQARTGVENQLQRVEMDAQKSIEAYQRQIEQASGAALDKFRQDTGILLEEVVFRLQQSARSFQSSTGNEVLSELQKASENLLEVSAAQMRKQTEQTLEFITERLKEKEEEVVSDAANVFRSRIADIFSILQAAPKKASELPDPEGVKKES